MSMVYMPLFIKVEMTRENYINLIREAGSQYQRTYLRESYHYDGTYFSLDVCNMDDFYISKEAAMIAKYVDPKKKIGGYIYHKGTSYSISELIFVNGTYNIGNKVVSKEGENELATYQRTKGEFFQQFPLPSNEGTISISDILPNVPSPKCYECLGMSLSALDQTLEQNGYQIEKMYRDMGRIFISLKGCEENAENILAKIYNANKVYLFCEDGDQEFPHEVMMLLG